MSREFVLATERGQGARPDARRDHRLSHATSAPPPDHPQAPGDIAPLGWKRYDDPVEKEAKLTSASAPSSPLVGSPSRPPPACAECTDRWSRRPSCQTALALSVASPRSRARHRELHPPCPMSSCRAALRGARRKKEAPSRAALPPRTADSLCTARQLTLVVGRVCLSLALVSWGGGGGDPHRTSGDLLAMMMMTDLQELKNGRLAMMAIMGELVQQKIWGVPMIADMMKGHFTPL